MRLLNTPLPPPPPFAYEEAYRRYLEGLLTNNRQQCRVCSSNGWRLRPSCARSMRTWSGARFTKWAIFGSEEPSVHVSRRISVATAISEGLLNLP